MDKLRYMIKTEEDIAENLGISVEEARERIRKSGFGEYQALIEASVDKSTQHTPQQDSFQSNITTSSDQMNSTNTKPKARHKVKVAMDNGTEVDLTYYKGEGDKLEYRDSSGKVYTLSPNEGQYGLGKTHKVIKGVKDTITTLGGEFMSGVRKGMSESDDITRLKELAGISETTTSGAIASAPSVIGDTSDSHKPTVQLRKRLRLEKEKREKDKAREEKTKNKGKAE